MAFSDAFARGYAIGDSMKKRLATKKFFEKFKELTADTDEEGEALPTEVKAVSAPEGAAPVPTAETALPVQSAGESGTAPILAPVKGAEAEAIPVKGPDKIPLADERQKKGMAKLNKSLTQDNIKELDRLALSAAEAAGDPEIYTALQKTTTSALQSKTLAALGQAQSAASEGDLDATKKYLSKAYRYVPDGREPKFTEKDGKLWIENPWKAEEGEPKEIELNAQRIGGLAVMLSDPAKYAELLREEGKERKLDKREERKMAIDKQRADTYRDQVNSQIESTNFNNDLEKQKFQEAQKNNVVDRFNAFQQGLYYEALADKAAAAAGENGTLDPAFVNAVTNLTEEINSQMRGYTQPPKNADGIPMDTTWTPPEDVQGLSKEQLGDAEAYAQAVGLANIGRLTPMEAVKMGIKIAANEGGFDPQTGMYQAPGMKPVQLPASVLRRIQQMNTSVGPANTPTGLPSPQDFMQR